MKGRHEVIPHLVQACPESTRVKAEEGETILHLCVKHSRLMSVVELLSDYMEFVHSKDNNGNTILHLAAMLQQEETIKFLLSKTGVREKVNSTNGNGFTAVDVLEHCPRDLKGMKIQDIMLEAGVQRARGLQADLAPASVNFPKNTRARTSSQNISLRSMAINGICLVGDSLE
ncbi:unnamed protein product [Ilex paraguariensis]|uniref:Uncharacterized protein n=1 Tax=Ilex paraguariensis TaxID=185542 RepID=A0ABC8UFW7_9AQUA